MGTKTHTTNGLNTTTAVLRPLADRVVSRPGRRQGAGERGDDDERDSAAGHHQRQADAGYGRGGG